MKRSLLYKNFLVVLMTDILLLLFSLYFSHQIRFDFDLPDAYWNTTIEILPIVLIIKVLIFYFFDLYRGMWRYTSITDLFNIIKAASLSSLIVISYILFKARFMGFSRSIFIIDWCFTIIFIAGFRLSIRLYFDHIVEDKDRLIHSRKIFHILNKKRANSKRLLIIGAGDCGEKIYREIRDNEQLKYNVVGFLDDDHKKSREKDSWHSRAWLY